MKFKESYLTRNPNYKRNRRMRPTGVMLSTIHKAQPSAKVLLNNYNNDKMEAVCPHVIIDHSGMVYHTLPLHLCSPSVDEGMIDVLLCEPGDVIRYDKKGHRTVVDAAKACEVEQRIYNAAVEICAQICMQNALNPKTAIYGADGEMDPEDLWDAIGFKKSMVEFLTDVERYIRVAMEEAPSAEPVAYVEPVVEEPKAEPTVTTVTTWRIRIDVDRLRIRSTPEVRPDNITGKYTGKGDFTIVEIQNGSGSNKGWGRLADGGWVSLDHVVML